jgi:hypothetical protein
MKKYQLPDPIKGLVIENEYTPDGSIRGLLKDNPELLADVKIVTYALHRQQEVVEELSSDRNPVIVASTFMYKDQLESLTKFIMSLEKPIYCFVQYAQSKMNDWLYEPSWNKSSFSDYDGFITNIKTLVSKGLVFEIDDDDDTSEIIHDDLHGIYGMHKDMDRKPWTLKQIFYSEKYAVFYRDGSNIEKVAEWNKPKSKD